jgi:hypothetical protein
LRTWLASRPLGRLPAQLGHMGPPLLVPANTLGSPPYLPLVNAAEIGKPRIAGFSFSGCGEARFQLRIISRPFHQRI